MKKRINELLESENAILEISEIATLYRLKGQRFSEDIDSLKIEFDSPTGRKCFYTKEIKSREFKEIIEEIKAATKIFAKKWQEEEITKIQNGYAIKGNVINI